MEREDLERLVESFGKVFEIKMSKTHAIVTIECGRRQAEEAIVALDRNYWMDNTIRVSFDKNGSSNETPEKEIAQIGNSETLPAVNESESATSELDKSPKTFEVFCNAVSKSFLKDICDMFIMFGTVDSSKYNPKTKTAQLVLNLNSEEVEWCISETNGKIYKGHPIKVRLVVPATSEPVESEEPETYKDEANVSEIGETFSAGCVFLYFLSKGLHPFANPDLGEYKVANNVTNGKIVNRIGIHNFKQFTISKNYCFFIF